MPTKSILLLKTGDSPESVRAERGDYDVIFPSYLPDADLEIEVVQAHRGEALPDLARVDGVIITGSSSSVTELEPWAQRASDWTAEAVDRGVPVLGVCYGHQLLAHALGGRVEVNPKGYEIGTIEVALTERGRRDALFEGMGVRLEFSSVHADAVTRLPERAEVLADNAKGIQAFSVGDHVRAVQFHPEVDQRIMELFVDARQDNVRRFAAERGEDPEAAVQQVRSGIHGTPWGPEILRRFVRRFVRARGVAR